MFSISYRKDYRNKMNFLGIGAIVFISGFTIELVFFRYRRLYFSQDLLKSLYFLGIETAFLSGFTIELVFFRYRRHFSQDLLQSLYFLGIGATSLRIYYRACIF